MFLYPNICVLSWEKVLLPSHIFSVCTRGENFDVFVSGRKRAVGRLMQNLQSYSRNQLCRDQLCCAEEIFLFLFWVKMFCFPQHLPAICKYVTWQQLAKKVPPREEWMNE